MPTWPAVGLDLDDDLGRDGVRLERHPEGALQRHGDRVDPDIGNGGAHAAGAPTSARGGAVLARVTRWVGRTTRIGAAPSPPSRSSSSWAEHRPSSSRSRSMTSIGGREEPGDVDVIAGDDREIVGQAHAEVGQRYEDAGREQVVPYQKSRRSIG